MANGIDATSVPLIKRQAQLNKAIEKARQAGDSSTARALTAQALTDGDTLLELAAAKGLNQGPTADAFERQQKEQAAGWLNLNMDNAKARHNIQVLNDAIQEVDASKNQKGLETTPILKSILAQIKADREERLNRSIYHIGSHGFGQ